MSGFDPRAHGIDLGGPRHGHEMTPAEVAGHHGEHEHIDLALRAAVAVALGAAREAQRTGGDPVAAALHGLSEWGFAVVQADDRHDDATTVAPDPAVGGTAPLTAGDYEDMARWLVSTADHLRYSDLGRYGWESLLSGQPFAREAHIDFVADHAARRVSEPGDRATIEHARRALLDLARQAADGPSETSGEALTSPDAPGGGGELHGPHGVLGTTPVSSDGMVGGRASRYAPHPAAEGDGA